MDTNNLRPDRSPARVRAPEADGDESIPSGTLPVERLMALRRRIMDRVQDSDLMADRVMRRIVDCGDLR